MVQIESVTPDYLMKIDDKALLALHRDVHDPVKQAGANHRALERAHAYIAAEVQSRGGQHRTPLDFAAEGEKLTLERVTAEALRKEKDDALLNLHRHIHGLAAQGKVDCEELKSAHKLVAAEVERRGGRHRTPLECGEKATGWRGWDGPEAEKAESNPGSRAGLYLEPPHGFLLWNGKKTAIAKSAHFVEQYGDRVVGEPLVVVSGDEAFGVVTLSRPAQMSLSEFDRREYLEQHRVRPEDRREWWPDEAALYVYPVKHFERYDEPRPVTVQPGTQNFISEVEFKAYQPPTEREERLLRQAAKLPKTVVLTPRAVSLTGSQVYGQHEPRDADVVVVGAEWRPEEDQFVVPLTPTFRLKMERLLKAVFGTEGPVQWIAEGAGPTFDHLPLFDLALVRRPRLEIERVSDNEPEFAEVAYDKKDVVLDEITSIGGKTCVRCGVALSEENTSDWEVFISDGSQTAPICKRCERSEPHAEKSLSASALDRALRGASDEVKRQAKATYDEDRVVPGRMVLSLKPMRPAPQGERQVAPQFYKYIEDNLEPPWYISPKRDGMTVYAHGSNERVWLFSDDGEDVTERLPRLVKALKKNFKGKSFVAGTEVEYWKDENHYPREAAVGAVKKGDDENLAMNIFRLIYWDGEDLHRMSFSGVYPLMEKLPVDTKSDGALSPQKDGPLNLVPHYKVDDIGELKTKLEKVAYQPGVEGVVVKRAGGDFPLNGQPGEPPTEVKFHKSTPLIVRITGKTETKTVGVFVYAFSIGDMEVGKTFGSALDIPIKSALTVEGEQLNVERDEDGDIVKVSVWAPEVMGPSDEEPESLETIVARAKKHGVLREKVRKADGTVEYLPNDPGEPETADKDFPDHAGRPGQVGGSLPRGAGKILPREHSPDQPALERLVNYVKGAEKINAVTGIRAILGKGTGDPLRMADSKEALALLRRNGFPDLPDFAEAVRHPTKEIRRVEKAPYNYILRANGEVEVSTGGAFIPFHDKEHEQEALRALKLPKNWSEVRWAVPGEKELEEEEAGSVADSIEDYIMSSEDKAMDYPPEDKKYPFVFQLHGRGRSVHGDLRTSAGDFLHGWTIALQQPGAIKEPIETLDALKEAAADPANWKMDLRTGEVKQRQIRGGTVRRGDLRAFSKATEVPKDWLNVEGVTDKPDPGEPVPAGATRQYPGVFYIVEKGTVEYGASKSYFTELFIHGDKWGDQRWTFRMIERKGEEEKAEILPPGVEEPDARSEVYWVLLQADPSEPYILSDEAVRKGWLPPKGVSCLPRSIRQHVPKELRYWEASGQEALDRRAKLAEMDVRELGGTETKDAGDWQPYVLQRRWWRGQVVIRFGASEEFYDLRVRQDGKHYHLVLQGDPLRAAPVAAYEETKETAPVKTAGGKRIDVFRIGEEPVELAPGQDANPTKDTPAFIQTVDEGEARVLTERPEFVKLEFKGGKLKGAWAFRKESLEGDLGEFMRSEGPEVKEAEKGVRPLFGSPGGKRALAQTIVALMPEHKTYVEPFAGGAAVLFAKEPSEKEVLSDLDGDIAFAYRTVKKLSDGDNERLNGMEWRVRQFDKVKQSKPDSELGRLHKWLYLRKSSYGWLGETPNTGAEADTETYPRNLGKLRDRLADVAVEHTSYDKALSKYDGKDAFFYLDPPYPGTDLGAAKEELRWEQADVEKLAERLKGLKGKWLLSLQDSPENRELFKGYQVRSISVGTVFNTGGGESAGRKRKELLVANYPLPKRIVRRRANG